tara:strand:+ start:240 stop:503 length:264 start_codon:yes stop_codon:yes gene_type:complete
MADDCKTGQVYSKKFKKCVSSNPDPDKTWGKYIGGTKPQEKGGQYFLDYIATEPEKAVIDSMQKEIMSRGKKKKTKGPIRKSDRYNY